MTPYRSAQRQSNSQCKCFSFWPILSPLNNVTMFECLYICSKNALTLLCILTFLKNKSMLLPLNNVNKNNIIFLCLRLGPTREVETSQDMGFLNLTFSSKFWTTKVSLSVLFCAKLSKKAMSPSLSGKFSDLLSRPVFPPFILITIKIHNPLSSIVDHQAAVRFELC